MKFNTDQDSTASTGQIIQNDANNVPPSQPERGQVVSPAGENVTVTISDQQSPIVVLFGPPSCGKTMTLIRLSRFLHQNGWGVMPVRTFRPSYDNRYAQLCNEWNNMVSNDMAASGTSTIDFMLLQVQDKRSATVCQILEAPGEHFFNPQHPDQSVRPYISKMQASANRKIWVIFIDMVLNTDATRHAAYVERIRDFSRHISLKRDRVIILCNKVDQSNRLTAGNIVNTKELMRDVNDHYPGLFEIYRNPSPLAGLFGHKYLFEFVPFQTGAYDKDYEDITTYTESDARYPSTLWKAIQKSIRG